MNVIKGNRLKKRKKKKNRISGGAGSLLKTGVFVLAVLVIVYLLITYVFRKTIVHNVSMQDTLYDGDNIIMDELSYNISDPKRFDIICFKSYTEKDLLIKRIVGLPGENIKITDGIIYINDREIRDVPGVKAVENPGIAYDGITLSEDEYFVLGDNRPESIDSRFKDVGNVRRKDILGKASIIIWPLNRIGIIK